MHYDIYIGPTLALSKGYISNLFHLLVIPLKTYLMNTKEGMQYTCSHQSHNDKLSCDLCLQNVCMHELNNVMYNVIISKRGN